MSTLLFSNLQIKTPKKIPSPKINWWDEKELYCWNVPQSFAPFLSSPVCGQKPRPDQCPPSWKDESCRWRQSRSHHLAGSSYSPGPSPHESINPDLCPQRAPAGRAGRGTDEGCEGCRGHSPEDIREALLGASVYPNTIKNLLVPRVITEKWARFSPHPLSH